VLLGSLSALTACDGIALIALIDVTTPLLAFTAQGFASTSLVMVGAGYTATRLGNLVLNPAKKGEMYSLFNVGYNAQYQQTYSLLRLSDVEG
jgi:hypothetical protein